MTTYCVVCRGRAMGRSQNPRTIRFYLNAASADRAVAAAALENPGFRVLGIEPGDPIVVSRNRLHAA